MVRHAPIHRRSGHSDIAICCGRNVRGSSPSTSVVPLPNQATTFNHKRFKGFKMFSDGHPEGPERPSSVFELRLPDQLESCVCRGCTFHPAGAISALPVGAAAVEKLAYLLLKLPNALFSASKTWGSRPVLYPCIDAICPELRQLEEAYPAIKQEYLAVRERLAHVPRYHEVDRLQYEISNSPSVSMNWRVFFLEAMGRKATLHRRQCPTTAGVLDQIPGVFQAFFSVLEGGKSIPPHGSPYWGYLRYHLALEVPKQGPQPQMRV